MGGYEPVPFDFSELWNPLSVIPDKAVDIVKSWREENDYTMFSHRGGRLLSNIFPTITEGIEKSSFL